MENMKLIELKIPNLGEAESTEIIEINIKKGDKIKTNDPLIVLESEKAAMEVPSDYDGEIAEVNIKEGDSVNEGVIYAKIYIDQKLKEPVTKEEKQDSKASKPLDADEIKFRNQAEQKNIDLSGINAGPAVRKYARELEINLNNISGTGRNARITKDDLKNFIHKKIKQHSAEDYLPTENDFKDFGDYELEKLTKIQTIGAKNLTQAWSNIPHVSHFEEINMTRINSLRENLNISPLCFFIKAITIALEEFPKFNSSLLKNNELLIRNYVNIGLAVDTSDGLVVPVIKNANEFRVSELSNIVKDLAKKAQDKKLLASDIKASTFTVSSLGKIGGTNFTPIINPPEVAILGISNSKKVLTLADGNIEELAITPISLSYDHRVINGADAGRFMVFLKETLDKFDEKYI